VIMCLRMKNLFILRCARPGMGVNMKKFSRYFVVEIAKVLRHYGFKCKKKNFFYLYSHSH